MYYSNFLLPVIGQATLLSLGYMALLLGIYKFTFAFVETNAALRSRVAFLLACIGTAGFLVSIILYAFEPQLPSVMQLAIAPAHRTLTLSLLGLTYVFFFAFTGLKLLLKWRNAAQLRKMPLTKAPYEWRLFVEKHAKWLGIRRQVSVLLTRGSSPCTFGWLKPVIFLPVSCIVQLPVREVEALLLHEIAHIARKDFIKEHFFQWVETLMWFNPFTRWLLHEARQEREKACDELVIQFGYPATSYSNALLTVAKNQTQSYYVLNATGKGQHHLFDRIQWMLTGRMNRIQFLRQSLFFLGTGLLLIALPFITGKEKKAAKAETTANVFMGAAVEVSSDFMDWQTQIAETRGILMLAQVNRPTPEEEPQQIESAINEMPPLLVGLEKVEQTALIATTEETIPVQTVGMPLPEIYDQLIQAEKLEAIAKRLEKLPGLIETLEEKRTLTGKAWEELITLIAYYSELKTEETEIKELQENLISTTQNKAEKKPAEVLVIAYDPETGNLASTMMPVDALPDGIEIDGQTKGEYQQVILLRKRSKTTSRIISL